MNRREQWDNFCYENKTKFDLRCMAAPHLPIPVATGDLSCIGNVPRVNHYLVKAAGQKKFSFGELSDRRLQWFIQSCADRMREVGVYLPERYCFVTIDNKQVGANKSQRMHGWHIDGLQGDEVRNKVEPDVQFCIYNSLPTLFTSQSFRVNDWDVSRHNIFHKIEEQIDNSKIVTYPCDTLLMMNAYCAHAAAKSDKVTDRLFIRVNFTKTPVTSIKMTINPDMNYNYPIHQTTGEIPKHLA